jgi:hypothetical protein
MNARVLALLSGLETQTGLRHATRFAGACSSVSSADYVGERHLVTAKRARPSSPNARRCELEERPLSGSDHRVPKLYLPRGRDEDMKSLLRRLERIEAAMPPKPRPDPAVDDEIMRLADARLSEEDRELVASMGQRQDLTGELTASEDKALAAFLFALTIELKRAGYRSLDEFDASYRKWR